MQGASPQHGLGLRLPVLGSEPPLDSGLALAEDLGVTSFHSKCALHRLVCFLTNSFQPMWTGISSFSFQPQKNITLLEGLALTALAAGCGPKPPPPATIGHSSYALGQIFLNQTNRSLQAEFTMPDASQAFLCLVLEGVDVRNAIETTQALGALLPIKLKCVITDAAQAKACWSATLRADDLGRFANWHSPQAAVIVNPPLISYSKSPSVREVTTNASAAQLMFRPGKQYRVLLSVETPAALTNKVTLRLDVWGVRVG